MVYSSKFRKYLAHVGTPANAQNNYIKLSGFGFNNTRLLHRKNDEKHNLPIKNSLTLKILSQFFKTNLSEFFRYFPFNFRQNGTGNDDLFSGKTDI